MIQLGEMIGGSGINTSSSVRSVPLTVDYRERAAAAVVLGGFFKREGPPTEKIDLPSHRPTTSPLFPKGG